MVVEQATVMKECGCCKANLPVAKFWVRRRGDGTEFQSYCRACCRVYRTLRANTEAVKATRYRDNRSESHKISMEKYMSKGNNRDKALERRREFGKTAMGRYVDARCKAKRRMISAKTERGREAARQAYEFATREIERLRAEKQKKARAELELLNVC